MTSVRRWFAGRPPGGGRRRWLTIKHLEAWTVMTLLSASLEPTAASTAHKHKRVKRLKVRIGEHLLFTGTHLRATERHLPYGIAQCYPPPDTGERALP